MESDQNEKHLIDKAQKGNQIAFRQLVHMYQDYVYSVCFSVLKTKHESEEAAQDTFIKLYKSIVKYNSTAKFSTWLYSIAYRTSIDHYRKRKNLIDIDEVDYALAGKEDGTEENIEQQDLSRVLKMAIQELPDEERKVISLFYLEELTVKEIQKILMLKESNIKVKLFRARKKLHTLLSQKYSAYL